MTTIAADPGTTKIDHRYVVMFNDSDGMVLAIELLGEGEATRLVLRKREGCTDEEIVSLVKEVMPDWQVYECPGTAIDQARE